LNSDGYKTRTLLMSSVTHPGSRVVARKKLPRFQLSQSSISAGYTYIDEPDIYHDGSVYRTNLGANGDFLRSLAAWDVTNAGDSDSDGELVSRVYMPSATGDTANDSIYIYMTTTGGDTGAEDLSSPTHVVDMAAIDPDWKPTRYSRPGIIVSKGNTFVYYHAVGDVVVCIPHLNGVWESPYVVANNLDVAGNAITVSPVGVDDVVLYYNDSRTNAYRVSRWKNGVLLFKNKFVDYHRDEYRSGFEHHSFDAEILDDGKVLIVAGNSPYGGSRYHTISDQVVSGGRIILPLDDVDWTGTLYVSSLSRINTLDGDSRIYAVAQQRFMQGNNEYSQPLTTLLWTSGDAQHWSQSSYHGVTTRMMLAKPVVIGGSLMLISPTQIIIGARTADFGGSSEYSEVDVSDAVTSWTIEMSQANASIVKVRLSTAEMEIFKTDEWVEYFDEVVVYVGAFDSDGVYHESKIMTAQVITSDFSNVVDEETLSVSARGPIGKMLSKIQFTDEILTRAVDERYDMNNNDIINRAGSTWDARDGWLITKWPNKNHESIAMNASPIRGEFFIKVRFKYGRNSSSAGVVFFADTNNEYGDEYQDHNHYVFRLDEAENIFVGLENKQPRIYRRTGTKNADGEWEDSLELLAEGDVYGYATNTNYKFSVQFTGGKVYVFREDDTDGPVLTWTPDRAVPKEYLCGIYAKTVSSTTVESAMPESKKITLVDASEFADADSVKIGKITYGYTKSGNTLNLDRGIEEFVSSGQTVTPTNDTVSFDWFQVNSAEPRYSVADVFRHVVARSGASAIIHRLFPLMGLTKIFGEYTVEVDGDDPYYDIGDTDTLLLSNQTLTNSAVEIKYNDFVAIDGSDVRLELRLQAGTVNAGFGVVIEKEYGNSFDRLNIYKYDGDTDDFSVNVPLFQNSIMQVPSSGIIRVVVSEGYVHVYSDGVYLASAYIKSIENLTWFCGVGGTNVEIRDLIAEVGNDVMLPGIWDATTQAKRIVTNMLKGRPLTYTETEDGKIELKLNYRHSQIGDINLDRIKQVAGGKSWERPGSALLLQGGYDWIVSFSEEMLGEVGLMWENVENHTLMSQETMLQYAKIHLAENKARIKGYSWSGRFDPVMQPTDSFHVRAFKAMPENDYIVGKMTVTYKSPTGSKAPSLTAKGTAYEDSKIPEPTIPR